MVTITEYDYHLTGDEPAETALCQDLEIVVGLEPRIGGLEPRMEGLEPRIVGLEPRERTI